MGKIEKMKMYQVVIEMMGGKTIFVDTNQQEEADSWIDTFKDSELGVSIKIFKFDNKIGYDLLYSDSKEKRRLIGFCRQGRPFGRPGGRAHKYSEK